MMDDPLQIIARGSRAAAEAAARDIDENPATESATYSILEEDEDHDVWRIDAFPTTSEEADALRKLLSGHSVLRMTTEVLADADWLAMALSVVIRRTEWPESSFLSASASSDVVGKASMRQTS